MGLSVAVLAVVVPNEEAGMGLLVLVLVGPVAMMVVMDGPDPVGEAGDPGGSRSALRLGGRPVAVASRDDRCESMACWCRIASARQCSPLRPAASSTRGLV